MKTRTLKNIISVLLLAGGLYFLLSGAREYFGSKLGQSEAERSFESPTVETGPAVPPVLGDALAKLTIPRLDTDLYVVEGTGRQELREGPGHMEGTALPGMPGNCIIAGHRDTHFRVLKDVKVGDDIVLQTRYGEFRYRITKLSIVSPKDTSSLQPSDGKILHLITCYPFYYIGAAPKRFIVQAKEEDGPPLPILDLPNS